MKNIQILTLLIFSVTLFQCQKKEQDNISSKKEIIKKRDNITINIGKDITATDTDYMKLYKYNEQNDCDQSKGVSVVYNGQLSPCFDYINTIKGKDMISFLTTIKNPKTYGAEDVACFDTNYSLILYNKKNEVIGYVNISNNCNKLTSNPKIKERELYSQDGLRKIGFSEEGKEKINHILEMYSNIKNK